MDKVDFERLFDEEVSAPLASLGFRAVGRSLHSIVGDAEVALIRLGGRMARPGAISHLLCVRKVWLRTRDERLPDKFVREPFDYPFKLRPSLLHDAKSLRYSPQNLKYAHDRLDFATEIESNTETPKKLRQRLQNARALVAELVVPWAAHLPAETLLNELNEYGEGAWIERLWIEDCIGRVQAAGPTSRCS